MNDVRRIGEENQKRDIHLIHLIRSGDNIAKEKLVQKYTPMVKHITRNYYASFLDFEDLMQEGLIGFLNAIDEYKPDQFNVRFSSFAYICIIRKVYNIIKQTTGNKHKALNNATSLYAYINSDENRIILDLIPNDYISIDPVTLIEDKHINQRLDQVLLNHLSLLEYSVIIMLLRGFSSGEIEAEIGVGSKVIDNARTRVKNKLRRIMQEYGSLLSPKVPTAVRKRKDLYFDLKLGG